MHTHVRSSMYYSDFKMAKKKDKKDLRKQRRRERLEENGDLVDEFDKIPHQIPETLPPDYGEGRS